MGRSITGMVAVLGVMGALQAPVAEASGWFHPIRAVEHAATDVGHAAKRAGTDALGAFNYETNGSQLMRSIGLLAFGVGVLTANPILIGVGVGLNSATAISWGVHAYQYDRATHIDDSAAAGIGGMNVGRMASTSGASSRSAASVEPAFANMGMHH